MITSDNGMRRFVIATPTKCATTSMEAVARRHMRNAEKPDQFRIMDWDHPRRQHRMCLPPGDVNWGAADRYLFVRDPFKRYISIYTYLSAPQNYSQWGARVIQGEEWGGHDKRKMLDEPKMSFKKFLVWLADQRQKADSVPGVRGDLRVGRAYRSPWVWTDSLTDSLSFLSSQPGMGSESVGLLRMEQLWDELEWLKDEYRIRDLSLSPVHANRSTGYGSGGADPWSKEFWGGIKCTKGMGKGGPVGWCGRCAACRIGVAAEASQLGYLV